MRSRSVWRVLLMVGALALLAATVPISGAGANGEVPVNGTYPLYAGQDIEVGVVTVTNDTTDLYVTFSTVGFSWCMTETHLAVGSELGGIPQTKKKNPIPGQFEYSGDHECEKTVAYGPIGVGLFAVTDPFYVAAHAVVWDMNSETTEGFFSDGDGKTLVTAWNVPLVTEPYPAVDAWEAFNDPVDTTDSTWDSRVTHDFVNADWIWESYRVVDWTTPQSVGFEHSFAVPGYPSGGGVYVAADNMYSASMNGVLLGEQTNYSNWPITGAYSFNPMMGKNTLAIVGTNYGNSSYTQYSNPAGLIFEGYYSYYTHEETAWGATGPGPGHTQFEGKNWATYFTYTIQPVLIETVNVPSRDPVVDSNKVVFSALLEDDVDYQLEASGMYDYGPRLADAHCSDRGGSTGWLNGDFLNTPRGNYLEVWVDGGVFGWSPGACDEADHEYSGSVTGAGVPISFTIMDACSATVDGCYTDNVGSIPVEIWWLG